MGVDESKIEDVLEAFRKAEVEEEKPKIEEKKYWKILAKYFLHGMGFSVLYLILTIVSIFVYSILISIGLFLGFIIGLALLMLIIGLSNNIFMTELWDVSMQTGFWSTLVHGITVFIMLLIVGVPFVIIELAAPSMITEVAILIVGSFPRGFIAKKVGEWWKTEEKEDWQY